MRENTLLVKKDTGLVYEITTPQARKWSNVVANPVKEQIDRSDKNAKWSIEYCQLENKPNPEAANEQIPQKLMTKSFPDDWHQAGAHPYVKKICTGAKVTLKPYQTESPYWVDFEYCRNTKGTNVTDSEMGEVLEFGRKPYCWNMFGWRFKDSANEQQDIDSYQMNVQLKFEGSRMGRGGIIFRGQSDYRYIRYNCKLNEWCNIHATKVNIPVSRRNRRWHKRIYLNLYYVPNGTNVKINITDMHVCGYDSNDFDVSKLGK